MDIRTLILARTGTVVLDPDRVGAAATRPSRDTDLDRLEDELAELGYVMTLDLAMTLRRLPHEAIQELRAWMLDTLRGDTPAPPPPAAGGPRFARARTGDPLGARPVFHLLAARPIQPCPWCATERELRALAPCGHLVCEPCWTGGAYVGCPVCHRRVAIPPFLARDAIAPTGAPPRTLPADAHLRLVFLGFDLVGVAREWLQRLVANPAPLAPADRRELEGIIDAIGPQAAAWLPRAIPRAETRAIAVARLWLVAPDRAAIARATAVHLATATDVLRVATILMGGDASLAASTRLRSIGRDLRRAILDTLDRLPADELGEHVARRRGLWKRVGERLHAFEDAARRPTATLAFALARGTALDTATFGPAVRARASAIATITLGEGGRLRHAPWLAPVEDGLRRGDPLLAIARLAQRPAQLLRRADHVRRVVDARAPATAADVLAAIRAAIRRADPRTLFALARHARRRPDPDGLARIVATELLARAERLRLFARAIVDGDAARAAGAWSGAWEVLAIHVAARANVIYVRDRGGLVTFRRRELEPTVQRLARLVAGGPDDGRATALPVTEAPTLYVIDAPAGLAIAPGSLGYVARPELARGTALEPLALDAWIDALAPIP